MKVQGDRTMHLLVKARLLFFFCLIVMFAGCSPEVGSEEWCEDMKEKPKGEWTANEAADYTKHCIIR
jgi:hypothetical protein